MCLKSFNELVDFSVDEASERILELLTEVVGRVAKAHSGYITPSSEDSYVLAFHNPRQVGWCVVGCGVVLCAVPSVLVVLCS
jgi:hypothetical protein